MLLIIVIIHKLVFLNFSLFTIKSYVYKLNVFYPSVLIIVITSYKLSLIIMNVERIINIYLFFYLESLFKFVFFYICYSNIETVTSYEVIKSSEKYYSK